MGTDAVASRQIQQFDLLAVLTDELSRFLFNRDSGIIRNFLP